jgi:hypothetical protein
MIIQNSKQLRLIGVQPRIMRDYIGGHCSARNQTSVADMGAKQAQH